MRVQSNGVANRAKTGNLPPLPRPATATTAPRKAAPGPTRSEALSRLRAAANSHDAALPWRNNADMNAKLSQVIMKKIKAGRVRSAAGINQIIRGVVAQNRSKLSYWDYDFKVNGAGKVALSLNFKGKLDAFDSSGVTLRTSVDQYIKGKKDPQLALAVLKQIDQPEQRIKQIRKFMCVPANVQRQIAKMNPQKYFVFATDLMTKGEATMPNGKKLSVSSANRQWIEKQNFSLNDKINAYYQAGLMDYGNGRARYDIAKDRSSDSKGQMTMAGLGIEAAQNLAQAAGGTPTLSPLSMRASAKRRGLKHVSRSAYFNEVARLAKGKAGVMVPMKVGDPRKRIFHAVTVIGMDRGKVGLYDPEKNQTRWMSKEKFLNALGTNLRSSDRVGGSWGAYSTQSTSKAYATSGYSATSYSAPSYYTASYKRW